MDNFSRLVPLPPDPPQPVTDFGDVCLEQIKALLAKWVKPSAPAERTPGADDE